MPFINEHHDSLCLCSVSPTDSPPLPITPDYGGPSVCYADGVFDNRFGRYIAVREEPKVLISGNDFYAFPRMDPKGEKIAWIEWGHPNMPWDKAELWVGYISEAGDIYKRVCVAGRDPEHVESPTEPKWSPKGELFFITDRHNGFWNLYKWIQSADEVLPLYPLNAEFARPLWIFGLNSYEVIQSDEQKTLIACSYRQSGRSYLAIIDVLQSSLSLLDIPFTDIQDITSGNACLYVEGASGLLPTSVAKVTFNDEKSKAIDFQIIWSSSPDSLKYMSYFSLPELIEFPTEVPGQNAYAYFYPPSNHVYQPCQEEKPPLLLESHGYGREFRERLLGRWGEVDVDDCCSCAKFLVDSGKVDGTRLCITGGSAGGYTTLAALAFRETSKLEPPSMV
ncbi:uncharacterized protein J3R85_004539 [Psidium guajava]|nr:uncharacterized protein J3R85_004539 [Psidium guajava]